MNFHRFILNGLYKDKYKLYLCLERKLAMKKYTKFYNGCPSCPVSPYRQPSQILTPPPRHSLVPISPYPAPMGLPSNWGSAEPVYPGK